MNERREDEWWMLEVWSSIFRRWEVASVPQDSIDSARAIRDQWQEAEPHNRFRIMRHYTMRIVEVAE